MKTGINMLSISYRFLTAAAACLSHKKIFSLGEQELKAYLVKNKDKRKTAPPGFVRRKNQVREWAVRGRPCYIITTKRDEPAARRGSGRQGPSKAILFIHGGGWIMEAHLIHWIVVSKLTARLGAAVWVPAYPLVPGATLQEMTEMIFRVYTKMLEEHPGAELSVLGDSAGGTLGLILCHHIKARGFSPMPRRLILVSPGTFISNNDIRDAMDRLAPRDPLVSTKIIDTLIPLLGIDVNRGGYFDLPLQGDFSGFPEIFLFLGTREIFLPMIPFFPDRVKACGVPITVYLGEGMIHIWPYMPVSRECRNALKLIFDIIGGRNVRRPDEPPP
jgi:acetyl esterase/lipase